MGGQTSKKGSDSKEPRVSLSVDPKQALFDNKKIESFLRSVPVLSKLTSSEEEELVRALTIKKYEPGEVIIRQGDEGLGFYIIAKGEVIVTREDKGVVSELGRLKGGDFFGEAALSAPGAKRGASVTASDATPSLITLYLDRTSFEAMFKKKDATVRFAKRKAVTGGGAMRAISKPPAGATKQKTKAQADAILKSVSSNVLFQSLEPSHRAGVVDEMYTTEVKAGTTVITQGDLGDNFYVIEEGSFDIYVNGVKVVNFAAGKCFGELALMYNSKRAATVTAAEDSKVWVVDRYTYRRVVSQISEKQFNTSVGFLNSVELLQPLAQYERIKIAEALEERSLSEGEFLFKQGDIGDSMYIIHSGSVRITHENASGQMEVLADIGRGAFFGERSLMKNEPRFGSVIATSDSILLRLDQTSFNLLLGPLEDILMTKVESYHPPKEHKANLATDTYEMKDLKVIGTLGKGSFGHVQLVQSKITSKTFALKGVSKQQIVNTGQQNHIMSEKKTMERMNHPFLIKLYATFKDRDRLYFLLEPSLGGELFSVLREKTLFEEDIARFFAACVVSAFEYMHDMDIIYRDLKPENLLLDEKGYLKITDFGFAKDISSKGRTFTLCGTPDYLAPEIVAGRGHGKGVDWWTLGVFIYEMLASYPPFFDEDPMQTYAKIMTGHITFPSHFSKEVVSLIKKLLHHKPTKRLGVVKGGAKLIKKHPWFKGLDWDALYNRQISAPFIPKIKSNTDLDNFDQSEEEDDEIELYQETDEPGPPWDAEF